MVIEAFQWLNIANEHIWHNWSIAFNNAFIGLRTHISSSTNANKSTLSLYSNSWKTKVYPSNEEGTTARSCDILVLGC